MNPNYCSCHGSRQLVWKVFDRNGDYTELPGHLEPNFANLPDLTFEDPGGGVQAIFRDWNGAVRVPRT